MDNKFKKYLDERGISPAAFSRMSKINLWTVCKAYKGDPLWKISNAKKIVLYTKGEVSLQDLGLK